MDIDRHIATLLNGGCLPERDLKLICDRAKEIFLEESNIQPVRAPVNVCGDIHGQFYDLQALMKEGGDIPSSNYIFIGDFVDRGYNSVETMEYLLCLKVKYPGNIMLLRGNHESRQCTQVYGFYEELLRKYGNSSPWRLFMDVFDCLPLGALIEGQILCVHGGLSPDMRTIDQIRTIDRKIEIPHEGPFCDLMWSDPEEVEYWAVNSRGAGFLFGAKVTKEFCRLNDLTLICRAHQLVMEGYKYWFPDQNLVTVWSAPNYCYRCGNIASILCLDENLNQNWKTFKEVPESAKSINPKSVLPYFL
ncbi:unnamed protein product [Paramecium primaurelia]|uniref:Serine/threonine-protein phosphatase n=2 Tax=Paramecium TaxID=5884 RepID=A0A8S1SR94_9CILI|nr:unnamed protein product [Paramecium primaurelia]CAD8143305.1 unnamed protein product [Paramecium pentaurelia]